MDKQEIEYLNIRRKTLDYARDHFSFLLEFGFSLNKIEMGESISFKDGWQIIYNSDNISVKIEYYDMELLITFIKGEISAPYLFVDYEIFGNASKFQGAMFPLEKLENAIHRISNDIKSNYRNILSGDNVVWKKIEFIVKNQQIKMKEEWEKTTLEYSNPFAREKADEAFRDKKYNIVVKLLTPLYSNLSESYKAKLEYSKKHSNK